jgi:hypothetical protein
MVLSQHLHGETEEKSQELSVWIMGRVAEFFPVLLMIQQLDTRKLIFRATHLNVNLVYAPSFHLLFPLFLPL